MSSQIPCKDLDRENTNLIDEEVHLMADLNSAGDRTDLGIPGMRKVFGYLLLVATGKPQSCENWSITNDKIFCCLNIYVFRFSSKIRSFQFLNTKYATVSLDLVSNCYCLQMYIISLSGRYATYRTLYHSKSVFISKLCGKR